MITTLVLKHFLGEREAAREGSKKDVRREATARGAIEKSKYVRVIEGKEVKRDDPIEYFLLTGVKSSF